MKPSRLVSRALALAVPLFWLACSAGPEPGRTSSDPPFSTSSDSLVVGGCTCVSGGTCAELSYSDIPADGMYYVTTFGGGSDTQTMSCGGTADGTWAYVAGRARFPCGSKLLLEANGKQCVAEVADCGPNRCVEEAASGSCSTHFPIMDASPYITKYLIGASSAGWSEHKLIKGTPIDDSTPTGCPAGPVGTGGAGGVGGSSGAGSGGTGTGGASGAGFGGSGVGGASGSGFGGSGVGGSGTGAVGGTGATGAGGFGASGGDPTGAGGFGASPGGGAGSSGEAGTGNVGFPGCSGAPDCALCTGCYDTCRCTYRGVDACLQACTPGGANTGGAGPGPAQPSTSHDDGACSASIARGAPRRQQGALLLLVAAAALAASRRRARS